MLTKLPNIRKITEDKLVPYYKQPVTKAILSSVLEKTIELDDAIVAFNELFFVQNARGVFLDIVGKKAVEERDGRDDEAYRRAIFIKIAINNSSGTPGDTISAVKSIFNPVSILLTETFPAAYHLFLRFKDNEAQDLEKIRTLVDIISPVGVDAYVSYTNAVPFVFAELLLSKRVLLDENGEKSYITEYISDEGGERGEGFAEAIYTPFCLDIGDGRVLALDNENELLGLEAEGYYDDYEVDDSYGGQLAENI